MVASLQPPPAPPAPGDERAPARPWAPVLFSVVVAAAFVGIVSWGWFVQSAEVPEDVAYDGRLLSAVYDPPRRPVEAALNARDGQVFATLAVDPTVRRPELIRNGPAEAAYRHQRPLLGWAGWLASGGDPDRVPWAVVGVSGLSVVAMVAMAALAIRRMGGPPVLAAALLVLPGSLADVTFVGPEALGCTLVIGGLLAWTRPTRATVPAVVAFALAGLCRETMLVVPAALALHELVSRRRLGPGTILASAALPYLGWVLALRQIVGAWPSGSVDGRLRSVPLAGLVEAAGAWPPGEVVAIGGTVGLALAGLVLAADHRWRVAVAATLGLGLFLGEPVWARSADVGRVLLPAAVLGLVCVAARLRRPATTG